MRHAPFAVLLLTLSLAPVPSPAGETSFRVIRQGLATVYVDGGRDDGLKVGDRLEVRASGTVVARVEVVSVNDHAAACRVLSLTRPIRIGDAAAPALPKPGPASPPRAAESKVAAPRPAAAPVAKAEPPAEKAPAPAPSVARVVTATPSDPKAEPSATKPAGGPEPVGTPPGFDPAPRARSRPKASPPAPDGVSAAKAEAPAEKAPSPVASVASAIAPPPPSSRIEPSATKPPAPVEKTPKASTPAGAASTTLPVSPSATPPARARAGFASISPRSSSSPAPAPSAPRVAVDPVPALLGDESFRVKYRSASNVYLEGGRAQGLMVGDQLRVRSGQTTIAELQVVYVAELSASCKVLSETRPVRAGDLAVAVARPGTVATTSTKPGAGTTTANAPAAPVAVASSPASSLSQGGAWARVRGGASFGFYKTWDETESGLDFEQRTARLDLGLYDIAGQPLTFTVRARSRQDIRARTLSFRTPADERVDRLYELALRYEPPSDRVAFEIGRIGIYRFVGIGYLDGAIGRAQVRPGLQLGAFGGRNAEIEGLGLEGTGGKYGAFVRLAPPGRYRIGGYDVLLAYVRENAEGDVSREYFSLESSFNGGSRWSLFQRAELDLNRGWRQEVTGKSHQFSNISLSGNLRVTPSAWAFVSYDGRRNYRYYRNRIVPEEVFDDLLHQGLRAGLNLARPGGFGASASFGMRLKESDPRHPELDVANAYSFNAGLRHSNLLSSGLSAGIDGSGFTNGYTEGGLLSAHLGVRFDSGHTLDFSYGYSLYSIIATEEDRTTQWLRFMGRAELGRRFYILGDFEYDAGDDLQGPRGFLELGVLF